MAIYVSRRILYNGLLLLGASLVVFYGLRFAPSDPTYSLLSSLAAEEQREALRHQLGLDNPLALQYVYFLKDAFGGDLGNSFVTGEDIGDIIVRSGRNSVILIASALLVTYMIAIPMGVVAALRRGSVLDRAVTGMASVAVGIPNFIVALILIYVFSVQLGWLPISGKGGVEHLIMPTIVLAAEGIGVILRITRASLLEQLSQDYVRTLFAKGLSNRTIVWRHTLRNSLIPIVAVSALRIGTIIGYTVIVEVIFRWPGIGYELVNSVTHRDYPVAQVLSVVLLASVVVVNLAADVVYGAVDPRVRVRFSGVTR